MDSITGTPVDLCLDDCSENYNNALRRDRYFSVAEQRFPYTYRALVLLLKVFLGASGLNITYEGGIGSFKTYVMVAHFLQTTCADVSANFGSCSSNSSSSSGGNSNIDACVGELFVSLLVYYGGYKVENEQSKSRRKARQNPHGRRGGKSPTFLPGGRARWRMNKKVQNDKIFTKWTMDSTICLNAHVWNQPEGSEDLVVNFSDTRKLEICLKKFRDTATILKGAIAWGAPEESTWAQRVAKPKSFFGFVEGSGGIGSTDGGERVRVRVNCKGKRNKRSLQEGVGDDQFKFGDNMPVCNTMDSAMKAFEKVLSRINEDEKSREKDSSPLLLPTKDNVHDVLSCVLDLGELATKRVKALHRVINACKDEDKDKPTHEVGTGGFPAWNTSTGTNEPVKRDGGFWMNLE